MTDIERAARVLDAEVLRLKAQVSAGETERMTEALWTRALAIEKLSIAIRALPASPVEAARDAVIESVATWRLAEKRVAAQLILGQIDSETFTKRNAEVTDLLHDIRIASDDLSNALLAAEAAQRAAGG